MRLAQHAFITFVNLRIGFIIIIIFFLIESSAFVLPQDQHSHMISFLTENAMKLDQVDLDTSLTQHSESSGQYCTLLIIMFLVSVQNVLCDV
jgi:hypothetical protein